MTNDLTPKGIVQVLPKETKDLYLAAALHAEGCNYLGIDRTDPTRMVFRFEGGDNADRVEKEWYQQRLVGSMSAYAQSIRQMKSLIHS